MEELFKDLTKYEEPKFGSFKWLEVQAGYNKISDLLKSDEQLKAALKDMLCMSVKRAMADVATSDGQLILPVVSKMLPDPLQMQEAAQDYTKDLMKHKNPHVDVNENYVETDFIAGVNYCIKFIEGNFC